MNLRTVSINDLVPAPYNPRVTLKPGMRGYEKLARSLREFDLVQPIVWNEQTGHIVSGHQRCQVLKDQNATEVEVVVVSLSLEREKALNITLNNSEVGGDWETQKLIDLIAELDSLPAFDATLTGFDAEELRDLVLAPDPLFEPDEPTEQDRVVRITLEVPPEQWDDVRPDVDQLTRDHALKLHVQEPH